MFENCPIDYTLSLISGKWKLLILRSLSQGRLRYGVLQKEIEGISAKVLTQQLREMEKDGLLERIVYPEVPPHVEYRLSRRGQELRPIMHELAQFGMKDSERCGSDCRQCKRCYPVTREVKSK